MATIRCSICKYEFYGTAQSPCPRCARLHIEKKEGGEDVDASICQIHLEKPHTGHAGFVRTNTALTDGVYEKLIRAEGVEDIFSRKKYAFDFHKGYFFSWDEVEDVIYAVIEEAWGEQHGKQREVPLPIEMSAIIIDSDGDYTLLDFGSAERPDIYLQMLNPSENTIHIERVADKCRNVYEALAWRNQTIEKPAQLS